MIVYLYKSYNCVHKTTTYHYKIGKLQGKFFKSNRCYRKFGLEVYKSLFEYNFYWFTITVDREWDRYKDIIKTIDKEK